MNISPRRPEINMIKSLELDRWVFPKGLEGKVLSDFEFLQGIIPADPVFGDVFVDDTEELVRIYCFLISSAALIRATLLS